MAKSILVYLAFCPLTLRAAGGTPISQGPSYLVSSLPQYSQLFIIFLAISRWRPSVKHFKTELKRTLFLNEKQP